MANRVATKRKFSKYGLDWDIDLSPLEVEFYFIRRDGYMNYGGRRYGNGPFFHYRAAQMLLWPEDDQHRWADEGLKAIAENEITVLIGPGDSGKTFTMAKFCLVDYWAQPQHVLSMISSTDGRSLELRIWGKIKELYNRAKDRYEWLAGKVLDSMKAISTDGIADDKERARELIKGLICVPCTEGSKFVGLSRFIGVKPPKDGKLRHFGDEFPPWLHRSWKPTTIGTASSFSRALCPVIQMTHAIHWALLVSRWRVGRRSLNRLKTTTWRSKFFNAMVVNFVGTDSPNFDHPPYPSYAYMVSHKKLDAVAKRYGKHSAAYYQQCIGVMKPGLLSDRIITRQLCRESFAQDKALWADNSRFRIYGCDPAYGRRRPLRRHRA
jgi:hypothetical protein